MSAILLHSMITTVLYHRMVRQLRHETHVFVPKGKSACFACKNVAELSDCYQLHWILTHTFWRCQVSLYHYSAYRNAHETSFRVSYFITPLFVTNSVGQGWRTDGTWYSLLSRFFVSFLLPDQCLYTCIYTYTWLRRDCVLTVWSRNFFLILAHPVYKMWIIKEPNTLELWNKLNFEEKKRRVYTTFKNIQYLYLLNKYIKCNV